MLLFFSTRNKSLSRLSCRRTLLPAMPRKGRFACFLFSMTMFCMVSESSSFRSCRASKSVWKMSTMTSRESPAWRSPRLRQSRLMVSRLLRLDGFS